LRPTRGRYGSRRREPGRAPAATAGGNSFHQEPRQVAEYEYALLAESGTAIETGAVAINVSARPYP
jgi:hypothetical protein